MWIIWAERNLDRDYLNISIILLNLTIKPEYLDPLPCDQFVVETEEAAAERGEIVPHSCSLWQTVHQLVLPAVPHQGELYEPADHHGLVHPEGGHQELGGLGQVDHQGQHEGCHREERRHPTCIWNLFDKYIILHFFDHFCISKPGNEESF